MKNVTLGAVVRNHARRQLLCPIRSWHQLCRYAFTLAVGLPVVATVRAMTLFCEQTSGRWEPKAIFPFHGSNATFGG